MHIRSTGPSSEAKAFARQWRASVRATDIDASDAASAIVKALITRARQGRRLRFDVLQDAARQWRERVPAEARLAPVVVRLDPRRKSLLIRDVVVVASSVMLENWPDEEPRDAVSALLLELIADADRISFLPVAVAVLQQHAIARWHDRALANGVDDLRADLAVLAAGYDAAISRAERDCTREFAVLTGRGGAWAGTIGRRTDQFGKAALTLMTQTFLSE